MIKGHADLSSTNLFFEKKKINPKIIRNTEWFSTFPIGMGTHLGNFSDLDSQEYIEAILYGIENGVNFIDTAINYRGMRSEKDVGKILDEAINVRKIAKREELIISTKCGLILGDITEGLRPNAYLEQVLKPLGIYENDFNHIADWDRHTLLPRFYEYAISKSKKNLGIETIDIHYVHIPEISRYALGEDRFYNQLRELFSFYEEQVKKGNIRFYGLATEEAFLNNENSEWYISLEKICKIAEEVSGKSHHFKFVQLPYNYTERTTAIKKYQKIVLKPVTAMEAAYELGINVIVNMPLNMGNIPMNMSVDEMLHFVTDELCVLAAMVGSKSQKHVASNIMGYISKYNTL